MEITANQEMTAHERLCDAECVEARVLLQGEACGRLYRRIKVKGSPLTRMNFCSREGVDAIDSKTGLHFVVLPHFIRFIRVFLSSLLSGAMRLEIETTPAHSRSACLISTSR